MAGKKISAPRTIKGFAGSIAKRLFVQSKYFRRALDRNKQITQILKLDKEYQKTYNKFVTAYEKAAEGLSKEERKTSRKRFSVEDTQFEIRSGSKIVENEGTYKQYRRILTKLFPELSESHELGHQNISVLRGYVALAISVAKKEGWPNDQIQALKALHQIITQIDKIEKKTGANESKLALVDTLRNISEAGLDVTVEWKKDVDIIQGINGVIEMGLEAEGLNQFKGNLASWVGSLFADIIRENLESFYKDLADVDLTFLKGSRTIVEDIEELVFTTIHPDKKYKKKVTSGRASAKGKKGKKVSARRRKGLRQPSTKIAKQSKGPAAMPLQLLGILNKQLPDIVKNNMNAPALENRTGRFAASTRITDIISTPQGFPSIGYTYDKSPYQTFEIGYEQGSPDRDPRKLIDRSIREIAAQYALGRFYTRRV